MGYAQEVARQDRSWLKLFKVSISTGDLFFQSKKTAKKLRDKTGSGCIVMRGPDHWRGESYGRSLYQTPSSKRGW